MVLVESPFKKIEALASESRPIGKILLLVSLFLLVKRLPYDLTLEREGYEGLA